MPDDQVQQVFKDYAREAVPDNRAVRFWHIGLIYIGVSLTLPAFLLGGQIGLSLGLYEGLTALVLASLILTALGLATGFIGADMRLSTYMMLYYTFGTRGAKAINILIGLSSFGWFGVTAALFAKAMQELPLPLDLPFAVWTGLGTALMISTAVFGFKGLDKLSIIVVPLLFLMLAAAVNEALDLASLDQLVSHNGGGQITMGQAVSILIGAWMAGVVMLPDISRYARTPRDGAYGALLAFLPGFILVLGLSMPPAIATGESDFIGILVSFGWTGWAMVLILLASWSSNDNNLYSSSLALASLLPNWPKWIITIIAGLAGGALATLGILDQFTVFLNLLGIVLPPVAGVYITDYLLKRSHYKLELDQLTQTFRPLSLLSCCGGALLGWTTAPQGHFGGGLFQLSTVPALDGLIAAGILQALFIGFPRAIAVLKKT